PYAFERGDELSRGRGTAAELAHHFPTPILAAVGDEIADSLYIVEPGRPRPLALFDAGRVDYSLRRLLHYTGTPWREIQPFILLTNYHRYVDQFVRWSLREIATGGPYHRLVGPGGLAVEAGEDEASALGRVAGAPWHRFQMPAYQPHGRGGRGGRGRRGPQARARSGTEGRAASGILRGYVQQGLIRHRRRF
ncbi:MAG: hypothetical protein IBJ10_07215, partial [Phycisphaerales bacterium]|nr:hypothetical protein [Phycisphaerales bacterium]